MNKHVGNGEYGVAGINQKVTFGGKLVHKLLETNKYLLFNNSQKCKGGPFTRVDPSDQSKLSCLSLVIISKGLYEYVDELKIDNQRQFTPHRAMRNKLVYTDHFGLIFILKQNPMKIKSFNKADSSVI